MGFRAIGRTLKISYGTVYKWIKKLGDNVSLPIKDKSVDIIELDEMHSYIGEKKTAVGSG